MLAVRKHQSLSLNIYLIDIVHVYDESLSYTHKLFGVVSQLGSQSFLCMGQIHCNTYFLLVGSNYISIVAITFEIDNLLNV